MKKYFFIIVFLIALIGKARGQDPQFSQFYSNSLYLAPSFAGLIAHNRLSFNYRNQWPEIPNGYVTYSVSFDKYFEKFHSGLGVLFLKDEAGSGKLRTTNIGLQYSFDIRIVKNWHFRPGMHLSYTERGIDFGDLVWSDQISASSTSPTSSEVPPIEHVGDIDFATSALAYSDKFWFGFNVDHTTQGTDITPDDIHTHSTPGNITHLVRCREPRLKYQIINLLIGKDILLP